MDRELPQIAIDYIDSVIKAMKYRKSIRQEVRRELTDHFLDALADCYNEPERLACTKALIAEFGDAKLLGTLLRRGKKRCRPLWQKTALAALKIVGVLFLLLALRVGYMAAGRPTISVDYAQWMNNKVRDGRDESLNAWHDYQKAFELLQNQTPEINKIYNYPLGQINTAEDLQTIEDFLETEAGAIAAFRAGTEKPYYWSHYQNTENDDKDLSVGLVENLMPNMSGRKEMARHIAHFLIPFNLHTGNHEQAIDDMLALCKYSQHLSNNGVLIENLVGFAANGLAWQTLSILLEQLGPSAEKLHEFQTIIESNYDPDTALMSWEMEKAFWYDQIQRTFTDDGKGSGRPLIRGTLLVIDDWKDYAGGMLTGFPGRREAIAMTDALFAQAEEIRTISPYDLEIGKYNLDKLARICENSGLLQQQSIPAIKKTLEIGWRARARQGGTISTLSILRFEKDNGRLPKDWAELLSRGYVKTIPMDPYSGKPLIYRTTDDGFTLYSVGLNFTDDGGRCGTKNGNTLPWTDTGDAVFWPNSVNSDQ